MTCAFTSRRTRRRWRRCAHRLDEPGRAAERRAAWLVIQDSRRRGALNALHINGPGAAHVFLRAAVEREARWADDADHILQRPDVDWNRWASYLAACGLARPLMPALADPEIADAAPAFFSEALRAASVREGIRELVQRDVLRQVEAGLASIGARGVLPEGDGARAEGPRDRGSGAAARHGRHRRLRGARARPSAPPAAARTRVPRRAATAAAFGRLAG